MMNIAKYSFFIYCAHEPVYEMLKHVVVMLTGKSEVAYIILYFVNPILIIAILILVAKILEKRLKVVYSLLMGRR